jgi:uncharacterized protein (TIRG00374 family)
MKVKLFKIITSLIIIIIIYLVYDLDIVRAIKNIRKPGFILFSLLIPVIVIPIIVNNRWQLFLKVLGINEKFINLVKINFSTAFLGLLLPSSIGYDAIRIYKIEQRHKEYKGNGLASVLIERVLGFYILSFIAIIGGIFCVFNGFSKYLLIISIIVNLMIFIIILIFKSKKLFGYFTKIISVRKIKNKFSDYFNHSYRAINTFPLTKVLFQSVPLILAFQMSTVLCAYLIFLSFDINVPFYYHLAFMPLISIISIVPISISGLGLREGGFVFFYNTVGVASDISFIVGLLYFIILAIFPAFIGMILFIFDKEKMDDFKTKIISSKEKEK